MMIVESRHWKGASNASLTARRQPGSSGLVQMGSIADRIALVTKDQQLEQRVRYLGIRSGRDPMCLECEEEVE